MLGFSVYGLSPKGGDAMRKPQKREKTNPTKVSIFSLNLRFLKWTLKVALQKQK